MRQRLCLTGRRWQCLPILRCTGTRSWRTWKWTERINVGLILQHESRRCILGVLLSQILKGNFWSKTFQFCMPASFDNNWINNYRFAVKKSNFLPATWQLNGNSVYSVINVILDTFSLFVVLQSVQGSFVYHDLGSLQIRKSYSLFDGTGSYCPFHHALHHILQHWPQLSIFIPLLTAGFHLVRGGAGEGTRWGKWRFRFRY